MMTQSHNQESRYLKIRIDNIRIDGGTQNRVEINQNTIREYSEAITEGATFPPVTVFFDGTDYWLADGFHRYWSHKHIGSLDIDADVANGSCRDAFIYSLGANHKHGLPRSNEDKRKSVLAALNDAELSKLSQAKIADICKVSREYVSRISQNIPSSCDRSQDTNRTVERNGKTYQQDTSNIGKSQHQKQSEENTELKAVKSQSDQNNDDANWTPDLDHQLKERDDIINDLRDEVDSLKTALSINQIPEGLEIDDIDSIIEEKNKELKSLRAQLSAIVKERDRCYIEIRELKSQCNYWERRCKKAEGSNA